MTPNGLKFNRCPKAWLFFEASEERETLADYHWMKAHGILPHAGGRLDQPAKFLQAVDVIDAELSRLRKPSATTAPPVPPGGLR